MEVLKDNQEECVDLLEIIFKDSRKTLAKISFLLFEFIFSIKFIMTRYEKNANGHYSIKGKNYEMLVGSRAQVWHGTAYKTSGGLKKTDLHQNKNGRVVSKAKHETAKKEKRLIKAGYGTKKGKFGFVLLGKKSKKQRGGKGDQSVNQNPAPFDSSNSSGVGTNSYNSKGGKSRRRKN
jgi:hypothetical protein